MSATLAELLAAMDPRPSSAAEAEAALNAKSLTVPDDAPLTVHGLIALFAASGQTDIADAIKGKGILLSPAETVLGNGEVATAEQAEQAFAEMGKKSLVRDSQLFAASLHSVATSAATQPDATIETVKAAIAAASK